MTGTEDELEALLHFLYAAPVGLVQADADGRIELINSYAARLLLPVAPQRGRLDNLFDVLANVAPGLRALARQAGHGALGAVQTLVLPAPGQAAEDALQADLTLHRMEGDRLMAVLLDTTARARQDRALRSGEDRLRFVIDAAGLGDWELDTVTGAMRVGPGFEACLGGGPGTGWTLDRLLRAVHDADRDAVEQAFDRALAEGGDWRAEFRVPSAGGLRWLALHGRPQGEPGPRRWLGVVADVSARREAEAARGEAERLALRNSQVEALAAMKSRFVSDLSHEVRTPMNAILGQVQLMRRDPQPPVTAGRLAKVERAARHLLQVVNDVLDLSKAEAGKLALRPEDFALDELLSGAMEMVLPAARAKDLELVLDTDHVPRRLRGDALRLSQALVNLLANAVRFTDRGHVRLRAELLDCHGAQCHVRFEVHDTGCGIPEPDQARLFQPFQQVGERQPGGTGLGLAMTRRFAQLMGGEAGVHSTPGEGSRFWFTARLEQAAEAAAADLLLAGRRVLLVDDLGPARDAISAQLVGLGVQVDAEPAVPPALGRAALAAAGGRGYDAVLVDWQMAPTDGLQAIRTLHEMLGPAAPPALLMTPGDEGPAWEAVRGAPVAAIVAKPLTASVLKSALQRVLAGVGAAASAPAPDIERDALLALERRVRERHAGCRVLLAEDNPVNQEVVTELLALVGLDVELAADGIEAVERAAREPFDLVLMDMQMPRMDGLQAMHALKARLPLPPPVVALTANTFDQDRQACLAAGMVAHLPKPLDPVQLYHCLMEYLPQDRPSRPRQQTAGEESGGASGT